MAIKCPKCGRSTSELEHNCRSCGFAVGNYIRNIELVRKNNSMANDSGSMTERPMDNRFKKVLLQRERAQEENGYHVSQSNGTPQGDIVKIRNSEATMNVGTESLRSIFPMQGGDTINLRRELAGVRKNGASDLQELTKMRGSQSEMRPNGHRQEGNFGANADRTATSGSMTQTGRLPNMGNSGIRPEIQSINNTGKLPNISQEGANDNFRRMTSVPDLNPKTNTQFNNQLRENEEDLFAYFARKQNRVNKKKLLLVGLFGIIVALSVILMIYKEVVVNNSLTRDVNFTMNYNQVLKAEKGMFKAKEPDTSSKDILVYSDVNYKGFTCDVTYYFDVNNKDKLNRISTKFKNTKRIYNSLIDSLKGDYGQYKYESRLVAGVQVDVITWKTKEGYGVELFTESDFIDVVVAESKQE